MGGGGGAGGHQVIEKQEDRLVKRLSEIVLGIKKA